MVSPRFRYASSRRRRETVSALKRTVSNTRSSGKKRTFDPRARVLPTAVRGCATRPATTFFSFSSQTLSKRMCQCLKSRHTSTSTQRLRALTTLAPTPCRPPE